MQVSNFSRQRAQQAQGNSNLLPHTCAVLAGKRNHSSWDLIPWARINLDTSVSVDPNKRQQTELKQWNDHVRHSIFSRSGHLSHNYCASVKVFYALSSFSSFLRLRSLTSLTSPCQSLSLLLDGSIASCGGTKVTQAQWVSQKHHPSASAEIRVKPD